MLDASMVSDVDVEAARHFKVAVFARSTGLDVVTGEVADDAHHVIGKQPLKRLAASTAHDERLDEQSYRTLLTRLLWDPRNGVAVTRSTHDAHHNRSRPIPRSSLPDCAFAFAREVGLERLIERDYPREEPC